MESNKKDSSPCKTYLLENSKNSTHLNTIVKEFDTDFSRFAHTIISKNNEMVMLNKIVGTQHSSYFGISWITLFDKVLQRSSSLNHISKDENVVCDVQYYIEGADYREQFYQSREWGVYVINEDEAYISEGNHRSVIAKLLSECNLIPNEIVFPYVSYVYCDIEALEKYRKTKILLEDMPQTQKHIEYISLDMNRELLSSEDNVRTFLLEYKLYIKIDKRNAPIYRVFTDMDTLLYFLDEVIDEYTPRPLHIKLYRFLHKLFTSLKY